MAKLNRFFKTIAGTVMSLALACAAIPMTAMSASAATITFSRGDVDGNGTVSVSDVTTITRYLNGGLYGDSNTITRMDAIQNKVIEMQDYNWILDCVTGGVSTSTITATTYTPPNDESSRYFKYNCDTGATSSYLLSTNISVAALNTRTFETYDDYVDNENLNTVQLSFSSGGVPGYVGSGFIIGDNLVATAAHCLYNENGYVQDLKVKVYDEAGTEATHTYDAEYIHIPRLFKIMLDSGSNATSNYDYGLIKVKNNNNYKGYENISQHGIWSLGCMTTEFMSTGANVISSGFTGDANQNKPYGRYYSQGPIIDYDESDPDLINDYKSLRFNAEAMVYGGKSGGPVYYEATYGGNTVKTVIGINVGQDESNMINGVQTGYEVWGTRITPTLLKFYLNNSNI